jgi:hypothetical protein
MTITIQSGWLAQAAPAITPLSGRQAQSWTNGLGAGAMVTADGRNLVLWTTTLMQYFEPATGLWSTVVAMPAGARPRGFAPIYQARSMFYDGTNGQVWGVDFGAGTATATPYVNSFVMRDIAGQNGTSWNVDQGPPAWFDAALPGFMAFPTIDLFGHTTMVLFDYTGAVPRLAAAMKSSDHQLTVYGVGNGAYAEQNPGAGDNGAMLPSRYMIRPGIGQVPSITSDYAGLASWFPADKRVPNSFPVPYTRYGAAAPYGWVASRQIDNGAVSIYNQVPTAFESSLQGILFAQAYTGTDGHGYVQGTLSGNSLVSVLFVGYDLPGQAFRLPISVAAPSPLHASSWLLMAMAGTAWVLDATPRLYSLALAQYDTVLTPTANWQRSPR